MVTTIFYQLDSKELCVYKRPEKLKFDEAVARIPEVIKMIKNLALVYNHKAEVFKATVVSPERSYVYTPEFSFTI